MIIAFTGKKKNGKSTVCNAIHETIFIQGRQVHRINFKDPLLDLARSIGWNGKKDEKGRMLLQRLGTDVIRECVDQDYWVKAWKSRVARCTHGSIILTDDVRFDNEARAVRSMGGGTLIFIESPTVNQSEGHDAHASEAGISSDLIDMRFENVPFGLDNLKKIAAEIMDRLKLNNIT